MSIERDGFIVYKIGELQFENIVAEVILTDSVGIPVMDIVFPRLKYIKKYFYVEPSNNHVVLKSNNGTLKFFRDKAIAMGYRTVKSLERDLENLLTMIPADKYSIRILNMVLSTDYSMILSGGDERLYELLFYKFTEKLHDYSGLFRKVISEPTFFTGTIITTRNGLSAIIFPRKIILTGSLLSEIIGFYRLLFRILYEVAEEIRNAGKLG